MSGFGRWLAATGLTVATGVAVPYGALSGGAPSFDVPVFWGLFGLAVIALVALGVWRWKV